jgi:pimeloyl-ACP methyl ester carboxylesterase
MTERYGEIRAPLLVVWGEKDRRLPKELGERLVGEVPEARLEVIRGAGHLPHQERPDGVNPLIVEALGDGDHPSPSSPPSLS